MCESTLLVMPTGSGKSLCYQLPAFILSCIDATKRTITVVVSPMISLMNDQLRCLPKHLTGAVISGENESSAAYKQLITKIMNHEVKILFVSPEKLRSQSFLQLKIPTVSFACIDEVHCMSEWSHNFRYFLIYS